MKNLPAIPKRDNVSTSKTEKPGLLEFFRVWESEMQAGFCANEAIAKDELFAYQVINIAIHSKYFPVSDWLKPHA